MSRASRLAMRECPASERCLARESSMRCLIFGLTASKAANPIHVLLTIRISCGRYPCISMKLE